MAGKVTVLTRVYNTKRYVEQCISSVLAQTYPDFEYILIDNGCTDGSSRILEEYAGKDGRIHLIRFEKNTRIYLKKLLKECGINEFLTVLDSDDWWEPDYLEKTLKLAGHTGADIIATGTVLHDMENGGAYPRSTAFSLVLDRLQFSEFFPNYHVFFRTVWAKLIRREVYLGACTMTPAMLTERKLSYGTDTIDAFSWLRQAEKICIDNSLLHHYRIHRTSSSYRYDPDRFTSDIYLYNDAVNFLTAYGPVSAKNRDFLQRVYSRAVTDTTGMIHNSSLAAAEKLREYRRIAAHSLTQAAYRECREEEAACSRTVLLQRALQAGSALQGGGDEDLRAVAQHLSPRCGRAVSASNAPLFLEDSGLFRGLVQDEPDTLLQEFLTRMKENRGIKKYAIPAAVQALAVEHPLLFQIDDAVFLRKYGEIYRRVWNRENLAALEEMTGLLLEDRVNSGQETFLRLYISLGAALEQEPAFVFGKLRLARLYFRQGRLTDCRAVVGELTAMGVESDELAALCRELEARE